MEGGGVRAGPFKIAFGMTGWQEKNGMIWESAKLELIDSHTEGSISADILR